MATDFYGDLTLCSLHVSDIAFERDGMWIGCVSFGLGVSPDFQPRQMVDVRLRFKGDPDASIPDIAPAFLAAANEAIACLGAFLDGSDLDSLRAAVEESMSAMDLAADARMKASVDAAFAG